MLNKPIFIGQTVLDDSKVLMQDFHYNFMLKQFERDNIDLLFTDTDSLCYHIRKQNPYEIIKKNTSLFDLSNYDKNHELYDKTNNKVIGKFKDETGGKQIIEFVGLKSKCYSFLTADMEEHIKCKGISKTITSNDDKIIEEKYLSHQNYKFQLMDDQGNIKLNEKPKRVIQNGFRSVNHNIISIENNKIALSSNDDKCYIKDDNINCLTFNHWRINN
jgi:hypothetical protein